MIELAYPDPELSDATVRLRPWDMSDLPCVEEASADPLLTEGTTVPLPYSDTEGRAFVLRQQSRLTDGTGLSLAIVDAERERAVGLAYLGLRQQPRTVGLGYWLVASARGRGLMSRAVFLVSRWALLSGLAERVEAHIEPDNLSSQDVVMRNGFQVEGRLRSYEVIGTRRADVLSYSLLKRDLG